MKKFFFLLTFGLAATTAGVVFAGNDDDVATLTEISGYQQWKRVNDKPVEVSVQAGTIAIDSTAV